MLVLKEDAQQRGPLDWNIRGDADASRQAQGAGLDHPEKKVPAGNWATRTRSSRGLKTGTGTTRDKESVARERRVKGGAESKKSGRPVKQNMNKSKERKGEEKKNTNREERREGDEGAAQKETTGEAGVREKEGTVSRTGASGARKKPHGNGAPWTGVPGGTQWQADKRKELGL